MNVLDLIIMASTYYGSDHSRLEQSMKNFHGIFLLAAGAKDDTIQNPASCGRRHRKRRKNPIWKLCPISNTRTKGTPQGDSTLGY